MGGRLACFVRYSSIFTLVLTGAFSITRTASADSFDWRTVNGYNWNTPIKSQFGGTCWDFSSCATLEAKYKLTRNDPLYNPNVSEQHICWEVNPDMGSTGGGWGPSVLNYFTSHGVVSETECPYQSSSPDVGVSPYWPLASGWESRVWKSVSNQNNITTDTNLMKTYLKMYGPMEVGCQSDNDLYNTVAELKANFRGPVNKEDHEVSLVGFYDDAEVPSGGYWVIKNSWGTGAGDNGYYYVPYGDLEIHNDISAITGAVYYTGAMATATWTGTTNSTWDTTYANRRNFSKGGANYQWVNQETQANFTSSATRRTITINGTAIAHGLNFSATGYSISNGSLTVTSGGIVTSEDVTINSEVFIGAPQLWNVAAGKTLNINGALHTIISDLTFTGAGNTTISSTIDGGGVLNLLGGAKPGGLIQSGTGIVTLSGESNFSGNITAHSGTLNIQPPSADSATFDGGFFGAGTININCSGVFTLGGSTSNFTGTLNMQQPGTLKFTPAVGVTSVFSGTINTTGPIIQDGPGTTIISGSSSYPNGLTIANGTLGLKDATAPGLLTGNFSVNGGTLEFNNVNVDSNFTGLISGSGGMNKSGGKKLTISGSTANTYTGDTNVLGGTLELNKTSCYAIPGNLNISSVSGLAFVRLLGENQIPPSATISFKGYSTQFLDLLGHSLTVACLSSTQASSYIENVGSDGGDYSTAVLTVDGAVDSVYKGGLQNAYGAGTGKLALVKSGSGTLTLSGNRCGFYTGGLTVNAGTLDYSGGILPTCDYTINGGTLNIGNLSKSIGTFHLTGGLVSGTGTLISNAAYDLQNGTVNAGLGGTVGLIKSGPGTVSLTKSLPSGDYTITDGTLDLNAISQPIGAFHLTGGVISGTGTLTSNAAYDLQNGTVNIALGGYAGLIKSGPGTVSLTKSLPGGDYTIADGTLNLNAFSKAIGAFHLTGGVVSGTGTLTSNADYDIQAGAVYSILAGGVGLNKTGQGTAILAKDNTYTGLTTITAGALQFGNGTPAGSVAGNIAIGTDGTLIINRTDNIAYAAKLSGTGTLVKNGSNILTLAGNSFSGNLTVNDGTLSYSGNSTLPVGNYTVTGGTLSLGSLSQSIGVFKITSGTVSGAGTLTSSADYDVHGGTIAASLGGSSGLVKTQDGPAILTGRNTYTGATQIEAGVLALSADGQIDPLSAINNNATFLIADGTHTVGVIDGPGSTLVGNSSVLNASSILQSTLTIGGDFSSLLVFSAPSSPTIATVPEPSTLALLASVGILFAALRLRKK